jgi:hypothetical protein
MRKIQGKHMTRHTLFTQNLKRNQIMQQFKTEQKYLLMLENQVMLMQQSERLK